MDDGTQFGHLRYAQVIPPKSSMQRGAHPWCRGSKLANPTTLNINQIFRTSDPIGGPPGARSRILLASHRLNARDTYDL